MVPTEFGVTLGAPTNARVAGARWWDVRSLGARNDTGNVGVSGALITTDSKLLLGRVKGRRINEVDKCAHRSRAPKRSDSHIFPLYKQEFILCVFRPILKMLVLL